MRRTLSAALLVGAALAMTACTTTRLLSTWKAPNVNTISFTKVLAAAVSSNPATRRAAEEMMVREIGPERAVASYTIIPDAEIQDAEKAKARVKAAGIDGAVVLRLLGIDQEVTYVPGSYSYTPYYGSFYGYWGHSWPAVYEPGYLRTDTVVKIETLIYSIKDDALLWAATSESVSPSGVDQLIGDLAKALSSKLRSEKLIP